MWEDFKFDNNQTFKTQEDERAAREKWATQNKGSIEDMKEISKITSSALSLNQHSESQNAQILAANSSRQVTALEKIARLAEEKWG